MRRIFTILSGAVLLIALYAAPASAAKQAGASVKDMVATAYQISNKIRVTLLIQYVECELPELGTFPPPAKLWLKAPEGL